MKYTSNVIGAFLSTALLAACGGSIGSPTTPTSAATPTALPSGGNYRVLYSFKGLSDGANPVAGLIESHGNLYGTTYNAGVPGCKGTGCGTVFEINTSDQERTVYRFKGDLDGAHPSSALLSVNKELFGTTESGGGPGCGNGCGTVFAISPSGHERIVYKFGSGADGSNPEAGLLNVSGELYGTTEYGGNATCQGGCGTVFKVAPSSGKESVVYRFRGGKDGFHPVAPLISVRGDLYGTTKSGGLVSSGSSYGCVYYSPGCGTVFKVSSDGKERVVARFFWSFSNPNGGATPTAPLVYADGRFYGTTILGGTNGNATMFGPGCGTIFAMRPLGRLDYIHIFQKPNSYSCNAAAPNSLIVEHDWLYGTTRDPGTIFKVNTSGAFKRLHKFTGGGDGREPLAGVVAAPDRLLYGTTSEGGGSGCYKNAGCGTVFEIMP